MTYNEAISRYGTDKPDLRFDLPIVTLTDIFKDTDFNAFSSVITNNGIIAGLAVSGAEQFSRKQIDKATDFVKKFGAKGLVWFKQSEDMLDGPVTKFLSEKEIHNLMLQTKSKKNDIVFIIAGDEEKTYRILGELRIYLGEYLKLVDDSKDSFLWVIDFPMLEFDDEENRYVARHHPFTSPILEDIDVLEKKPEKVKSRAYDLVMNGNEIAGGSIRIHQVDLQQRVFNMLGISEQEAKEKFGFLIDALGFGAPPHGGIAFGFDRLTMILANANSLRDVIAFPKTTSALSLMDGSPSAITEKQLLELGLKLKRNKD